MPEAMSGEPVAWIRDGVLMTHEQYTRWSVERPIVVQGMSPLYPHPSAAGVTEADLLPLARLGAWTLEHIRGHAAGDVEAWAVQDQAVQLGVIGPVPAPKPCGECCVCEEMDAETCYRDTDATKRARAFLTAALTAARGRGGA